MLPPSVSVAPPPTDLKEYQAVCRLRRLCNDVTNTPRLWLTNRPAPNKESVG